MGIHNVVDITGQAHGEFGQGDGLGIPTACGATLDVHGWAARRLTNTPTNIFSTLPKAFNEPHAGGCFSFSKWGRGNRRYLNIFAVRAILQAINNFHEVKFSQASVRDDFILFQA